VAGTPQRQEHGDARRAGSRLTSTVLVRDLSRHPLQARKVKKTKAFSTTYRLIPTYYRLDAVSRYRLPNAFRLRFGTDTVIRFPVADSGLTPKKATAPAVSRGPRPPE
jgi:hypothetical protein